MKQGLTTTDGMADGNCKWEHACGLQIYDCVSNEDGQILVSPRNGDAPFTVKDFATLKLENMGR